MGLMTHSKGVPIRALTSFLVAIDALRNIWPVDEQTASLDEPGYSINTFTQEGTKIALLMEGDNAVATWRENA